MIGGVHQSATAGKGDGGFIATQGTVWPVAGPNAATRGHGRAGRGELGHDSYGLNRLGCLLLLLFPFFLFLFYFPFYFLGSYACIHVLPTYIHPCGVH